jgi:hypothetical protein
MRSLPRRWKFIGGVALGLAAVAVSAVLLIRPVLRWQLAAAGWPHATIASVRVHSHGLTVSGVDLLGDGQVTAQQVHSDWSLAQVAVNGLAITVPTANWQALAPATSANTDATAPLTWPLAELRLNDAVITIGSQRVEVDATIVRLQPRLVHLTVQATSPAQASIDLDGTASLSGDGDVHLVARRLPLELLASTLPPSLLPRATQGLVSGDVRLTRSAGVLGVAGEFAISEPRTTLPLVGEVRARQLAGRIHWSSATPAVFAGEVHVEAVQAQVLGIAIEVPKATLLSHDQRFDLAGRARLLGADLDLDAHASADLASAAGSLRFAGVDLAALAGLIRPWLPLPISASGQAGLAMTFTKLAETWHGRGMVSCTALRVASADGSATLNAPSLLTEISAQWLDRRLSGTAVLQVQHAEVNAPGVRIASIDGTLPWSLGTDPQLDGSLQFTGVEVAGFPLRQLAAHVRGVDQRIGGAARLAVLDHGQGQVDGWYDLRQRGGTFAVVVPRFTIVDPAAVRRAVPDMGQRELTGDLDVSGTVVVTREQIIPNLHLSLAEGTFRDPQAQLTVEGLAAATAITGFTPFSTAGTKQVTFRSATIGSLVFGDGSARVTARLPAGIDISAASIAWCGGRLTIPELAVDLVHGQASGVIGLSRIELGALLELTIPRQVSGGGLISGNLPLTLTWPDYVFAFGRGSLQADPASGWLHLKDRTALISAIRTGFVVVDTQIVDTVADLLFDSLRIEFVPETPLTSVARVHLSGHGRHGEQPLAIGSLDLNLRGLERALADALFMQRWQNQPAAGDASTPPDSTIDRFFAP